MTDDVDGSAALGGKGPDDGDEILELALDRVVSCVPRRTPPAAIDGVCGVAGGEERTARPPCRVIGRGSVDEDERWPGAG
jgi:hypothetical protein